MGFFQRLCEALAAREEEQRQQGKPSAFAPRHRLEDSGAKGSGAQDASAAQGDQGGQAGADASSRPVRANRVIAVLMLLSLAASAAEIVTQLLFSGENIISLVRGTTNAPAVVAIVYLVLVAANVIGLFAIIYLDRIGRVYSARMVIRVLVVLLIAGLLVFVILNGITWAASFYIEQFICVVAYQVYNDPNLARPPKFLNPFKEGKDARAKAYELDPDRRGYIPLNFFNLFWIFIVASIVGLCMEMVFCLLERGVWESRAGLVWGPFSPIYGFGALLMTIALNRWWYRNIALIFVVSGFIGAAFEFFVSWYMEVAFGVSAWDYSGTFLSIDGRTDFAHFCAWGLCGLLWIRLVLPEVMRVVDMIVLKWRALVTVAMLVFMIVNATVTMLALDCWSQRQAGIEPTTELQMFFAENFDDAYMKERFSTMAISQESALHAQEASLL